MDRYDTDLIPKICLMISLDLFYFSQRWGWVRLWSPHLWWPWWARETQRRHGRCGLHWLLSLWSLSCWFMYIYVYIYIYTHIHICWDDLIFMISISFHTFAYILISIEYMHGISLPAAFWRTSPSRWGCNFRLASPLMRHLQQIANLFSKKWIFLDICLDIFGYYQWMRIGILAIIGFCMFLASFV